MFFRNSGVDSMLYHMVMHELGNHLLGIRHNIDKKVTTVSKSYEIENYIVQVNNYLANDVLVKLLHQIYPDIVNQAYKARFEVCSNDGFTHIYPNDILTILHDMCDIKGIAWLVDIK